jgi:hypothetical protein
MMNKKFLSLLSILVMFTYCNIYSQPVDSSSFRIYSRLSFYSFEKNGEFLLHVPSNLVKSSLSVTISTREKIIASWKGKPDRSILRIPFANDLSPSTYKTTAKISAGSGSEMRYLANTDLVILSYKPNEVKTDRLTGGMIVNKRPFFPFGFYCYSPVSPTLPEEEVVKGFNMISPYQTILPETLGERKAYMDRCAQLGMKVHYNLISLSGQGGSNSKTEKLTAEE